MDLMLNHFMKEREKGGALEFNTRECAKATFRFSSSNLQWTVYNCVCVCATLTTTTFKPSYKLLPDLKYSVWNQYLDYVAHARSTSGRGLPLFRCPFLLEGTFSSSAPNYAAILLFHPLRICRKINNSLSAHTSCKALSSIYWGRKREGERAILTFTHRLFRVSSVLYSVKPAGNFSFYTSLIICVYKYECICCTHSRPHPHPHMCPSIYVYFCLFFIMLLSSPLTLKTLSFDRFHIKAAANKLNALRG